MQKLLISVRGKNEALTAVRGGAHIVDVEYPASALGTPYPLNIYAVKNNMPPNIEVSTNIGEEQLNSGTACQAALGVAVAGADIVKAGLAKMTFPQAVKLGTNIVRTVKYRKFGLDRKVIPALFIDPDMVKNYIDPIEKGPLLAQKIKADGILIDTFDKSRGYGLWDYASIESIRRFVEHCHSLNLEAWIAGSVRKEHLPDYWAAGVDVICVRGAACENIAAEGRFAVISEEKVSALVLTIPV